MRSASRLVAFVVFALLSASVGSAAPVAEAASALPLYRVDVVVPNGNAISINDSGDLAGWQVVNGSPRAFVHRQGSLALLPTAADRPLSVARDINNAGVVVGYAYKSTTDEPGNAMRWTSGP